MLTSLSSSAVLGEQIYGPYGNQRYTQGTMGTDKGYTGQFQDAVIGLDYYNARYYDPVMGQFLSADNVQGNAQGFDPYSYVNGNPETATDPTGQRISCPPDCGTTKGGIPCAYGGSDCGPKHGGGDCGNKCGGGSKTTKLLDCQRGYEQKGSSCVKDGNGKGSKKNDDGLQVLKGAAVLSAGLLKLFQTLIRNNTKFNYDFGSGDWTVLRAVKGTDIVNDHSAGEFPNRWYFTIKTGEDDNGKDIIVIISVDVNLDSTKDPFNMREAHFASDDFQPNAEVWGEDGSMRNTAGVDEGASANPGDDSDMPFWKIMLAKDEANAEADPVAAAEISAADTMAEMELGDE